MKDFKHICPSCNGHNGDIFSISQTSKNKVVIDYICKDCGFMNAKINYLYEAETNTKTLEELDFSVITYNYLKRHGINYKSDLEAMTESDLLRVRNLGRSGVEEVKKKVNIEDDINFPKLILTKEERMQAKADLLEELR
jgi:DNA-directed RNA polymerase alpha subunit